MTALQVKSIILAILTTFISNTLFSQEVSYTDKEEYFIGQSKRVLKVNFIGNFFGTTKISYEQITKPGRSLELKATLVDGGKQSAFGSIGYKFYKKPTFIAPDMQRRNILEGTYFKPEIFIGKAKDEFIFDRENESKFAGGLLINIGKQWVFGKHFVIDTYVGTGLGSGTNLRGYIGSNGLIVTAGLNFGFAF